MYRIIGADGNQYGPISTEQLRQWIAEGRANAQTKVLAEGTTEWKPLSEFPEFFASAPGPAGPHPTNSIVSRPDLRRRAHLPGGQSRDADGHVFRENALKCGAS